MSDITAHNERGTMKKTISAFFVVLLLASVLIGILAVIPEQVRAATGDVVKLFSAPTGTQPNGLAWDGSNLWMSSYMREGGIYKLGPVDGSMLGKYTPPVAQYNGYGGLTYDGTYLWEADGYGGGIYMLDPSDCSVISSIPSPDRSLGDLAWDGDHLWLCGYPTQKIYKISPIDGSIVAEFKVPEGTGQAQTAGLTYAGEYLWLSGTSDILKLDPSDCEVISSFPAPCSRPGSLAWDGEYLWCASFDEAMIYQIDSGFVAEPKVPISPQNLQATPGDGYVDLRWSAPNEDGGSPITGYEIYRDTTSVGETLLTTVGNVTTYNDTSVNYNQTYYYQVSAVNVAGEGPLSNEVSVTTPTPTSGVTTPSAPLVKVPSAPLNFKASAGDGNLNLEWREPSDDGDSPITNYNIYRGTTSGGETLRETVSNVLSYTDDTVISNQTYYYQVSAENSAGEGGRSDEKNATLIPGVTVPSAPQNLEATPGDGYVSLKWFHARDDGGSPITNYNIYRGTAPGGEIFLMPVVNVLSYTDDDVINDQSYYYQVSAENLAGEGERSNEVGVEPKGDTTDMGVWITIIVALIGALGVIAAALINYLSSKKTK